MKFLVSAVTCCTLLAQPALHLTEGPEVQAALDRITADSLREHLSFIASDALEGRNTPSRGLDIAADYIADQFRRARLEAPVNGGYFQYADFFQLTRAKEGVSLTLENRGKESVHVDAPDATVLRGDSAIDLNVRAALQTIG